MPIAIALLLLASVDVQGQGPGVLISEFLAINDGGLRDEDGDTSDWIELFNPDATAVNLGGWYLTDNASDRTKWRFPSIVVPARSFLLVFASGKDRNDSTRPLHTSFSLNAGGEYLALIQPDGITVNSAFPATPQSANVSTGYAFVPSTNSVLLDSNTPVRIRIPRSDPMDNWIQLDSVDTNWLSAPAAVGFDTSSTYAPLIRGDLLSVMRDINATAQIRARFTVPDPSLVNELSLDVLYDDGFIAYVNGREIGRGNAPASPAWNIAATAAVPSPGPGRATVVGLNRDGLLVPGTNLLAIYGLNVFSTDTDFLLVPLLSGRQLTIVTNDLVSLTPSPGIPNGNALFRPGPVLSNAVHNPSVPGADDHIHVTVTAFVRRDPITEVTLNYRVMFGPTNSIPMFDDGQHGDRLAGDGVFAAVIPAHFASAGQMLRWFISARDAGGGVSREPKFLLPAESEEYFGTVIEPNQVSSTLPVIHLFAGPGQQSLVDGSQGGRVSIFHDGEFYDNVEMSLRGNTAASLAKKSHRLRFNRDGEFRHPGPGGRVRETSLLAEYTDASYLRQSLTYWLMEAFGTRAPFHYPVRLQLNGQFYQLAFHSEVLGKEMLERMGYDPQGALYKSVGTLYPGFTSGGGFEKVTPADSNRADYLELARGISEANPLGVRATNLFDLVDVPNVINYMAVARWAQAAEDVYAHMSLYRDSQGDRLWRIIPYSMDLTWGQLYCGEAPSLFNAILSTNDNYKSHPLYGGSSVLPSAGSPSWNRLYDVIVRTPATREMLLRRMRTLLDQLIQSPQPPARGLLEQRLEGMTDLVVEEATLDRLRWGWPQGQGPYCFGTNQWLTDHIPAMLDRFIAPRRLHWYATHSITNAARPVGIFATNNAGIPLSQPPGVSIFITTIEYNPSTGNQAEEYIALYNPYPYAVDVSGWHLDGSISFTFRPGTVVARNSVLYVSPDVNAFRARAIPPRGGQGLFIVGNYARQLSARGGEVQLITGEGIHVESIFYPGSPSTPQQLLRLTEVMYHPALPVGSPYSEDEFEFIELLNSGSIVLDLTGVHFTNSLSFSFTGAAITSLEPGARLLIVRNSEAFAWLYGSNLPVAGQFSGKLDDSRQTLQLDDASGEDILEFTYQADWDRITDGAGFSLVASNEPLSTDRWLSSTNWRPSGLVGGSPGQPDPPRLRLPRVLINEVLAHAQPPYKDAIELFNPEPFDVDLSGWYLTDDFQRPGKFRLPDGTWIAAGGYLAFDDTLFNSSLLPPGTGFSFRADGDEVCLFSGNADGLLTGYYHGFSFGATEANVTLGRHVTSTGAEHFVAQSALTFGYSNAPPKVGPIIFSELMYHPAETRRYGDVIDNTDDEFIELRNITSQTVPLFHASNSNWTWRLGRGVNFDLPAVLLPPGGHLLVVSFDPLLKPTQLAQFRARYGVPSNVPVLGPYSGKLANGGETLELLEPDPTTTNQAVYVVVERLDYLDYGLSDGSGAALRRRNDGAYGNDLANWFDGLGTPGTAEPIDQAPILIRRPTSQRVAAGETTSFSLEAGGTPPLTYQWFHDGHPILGGTNATLVLSNVQPVQGGFYECVVLNPSGAATTLDSDSPIQLTVLPAVRILQQPAHLTLRGSTNHADYGFTTNQATFSVVATGTGLLRYQWRFNGSELPDATNSSLTVVEAGLAHDGLYGVQVADDLSTNRSALARLKVLVSPTFVQTPLNQLVPSNSSFSVGAVIRGNPPPFRYEWRDLSTPIRTNITDDTTNYFTFGPVTNSVPRVFRVVVFNEANPAPGALGQFTVVAVDDSDGDGLPDEWETRFGLNPTNRTDAQLDADGDTSSNRAEYLAGTDPSDPASFLKVDQLVLAGEPVQTIVRFGAVSNRTYTLGVADSALAGPWSRLADVPAASTNRVVTVSDPGPTNRVQRFYRVATPRVP